MILFPKCMDAFDRAVWRAQQNGWYYDVIETTADIGEDYNVGIEVVVLYSIHSPEPDIGTRLEYYPHEVWLVNKPWLDEGNCTLDQKLFDLHCKDDVISQWEDEKYGD